MSSAGIPFPDTERPPPQTRLHIPASIDGPGEQYGDAFPTGELKPVKGTELRLQRTRRRCPRRSFPRRQFLSPANAPTAQPK